MSATLSLIVLAGAIALLLWGLHMVQSGIQRAFGPNLRRFLGRALGDRLRAFAAGIGVTAVLQSSTATGLMAASFAAGGLVDLVPALAIMLGANLGTTLIVQLLSFDIGRVAPLFVLIGVILFRKSAQSRSRDLGRVAIGLGLMLLALQLLLALITPYEDVPSLRLLMGAIAMQPIIDVILAAALTWAAHSSVATILLTAAFAAKGVVPPHAAFALVLGANLGAALIPLLEGSGSGDPAAKRLPVGNLVNRLIGCALGLLLLDWAGPLIVSLEPDPARAVADFHTLFNLATAALFLPLLGPFARLLVRLLPARTAPSDPSRPLYLDEGARETPALALAAAAREALRMADVTEAMLRGALDALDRGGVYDRGCARGAWVIAREGSLSRHGGACDRGAFRTHPRRPRRECRDQRAPSRCPARHEADQRSPRRGRLPGIGKSWRAPAEPPPQRARCQPLISKRRHSGARRARKMRAAL